MISKKLRRLKWLGVPITYKLIHVNYSRKRVRSYGISKSERRRMLIEACEEAVDLSIKKVRCRKCALTLMTKSSPDSYKVCEQCGARWSDEEI
jgi:hypothetical protein